MSIKINNPENTDLKKNTIWMTSPSQIDHTGEEQNSGSTPTISVKITSGGKSKEDLEKAMERVITKNEELYKRLAE